ncbi:MAG: hypothetical protein KAI38_01080 [Candidatus Latescibacteria bacterium]|nr:hypothetical protein [Candidatus Latescibacterota bacterium]
MRKGTVFCLSLLLLFATSLHAEEEEPAQPESKASYAAAVGSVTIDGKQWQRISLRPDIPIGKFGVALDIEIFVDDQGNFNKKGWDFDTTEDAVESVLRKIYYVRYGRSGEPVFVKVGALDNVTLGYGLMMEGYCNSLEYPGVKKLGLQFDVRNLSPMDVGIQGMINNFEDLGRAGAVIGGRLSARPMATMGIPVLSKLEIGAGYVRDMDQFGGFRDTDDDTYPDVVDDFPDDGDRWVDTDGNGIADPEDIDDDGNGVIDGDWGQEGNTLTKEQVDALTASGIPVDLAVDRKTPFTTDEEDAFSMVGFDLGIPVVERGPLNVTLYGQYAMSLDDEDGQKAEGFGLAAPGVRVKMGPMGAKLEYRRLDGRFLPEYFDRLYESQRAQIDLSTGIPILKDASLDSVVLSGVFGSADLNLANLVGVSAGYQYLTGDADEEDDQVRQLFSARASLTSMMLERIPKVDAAEAYYLKNDIGAEEDKGFFEATTGTLYGYKLGLALSSGVSLVWNAQYQYRITEGGDLESEKNVVIETVMRF